MSIESKWGSRYCSKENPRNPEGGGIKEILTRVRAAFRAAAEETIGNQEEN